MDLQRLKGVGPSVASRIVNEREKSPFRDLKDVCNRVQGISMRTIESWSEQREVLIGFEPQQSPERYAFHFGSKLFAFCILIAILLTVAHYVGLNQVKYQQNPPPLNATANHTIYFECMYDRDCEHGQRCYPGKLHPEEKLFDLSNYTESDNYWIDSKFGLEPLTRADAHLMGHYNLESGRRCWSTTNQIGADCGDGVHQICDFRDNLTCVYGKCRKTNDMKMVRGPMVKGSAFTSKQMMFCFDFSECLFTHSTGSYVDVEPTMGYVSSQAQKYWDDRLDSLLISPEHRLNAMARRKMSNSTRYHETRPLLKEFDFPKEFGVHLIMDTNLTSGIDFATQAEAEDYYIEVIKRVSDFYEETLGFRLRVKSFCWTKGYFWDSVSMFKGPIFEPLRRETNINLIFFVKWISFKAWDVPGDHGNLGKAVYGSIWFNHAVKSPWSFDENVRGPSMIRLWHLESYKGMDQRVTTITHEVAHTIGALESWRIPKQLGGPYFGDAVDHFGCGDEIGTIMSYCENSTLEFLNATKRDHERKMGIVEVHGWTEFAPWLDDKPLMGLTEELDCGICKQVRKNVEAWISGEVVEVDNVTETFETDTWSMQRESKLLDLAVKCMMFMVGALFGMFGLQIFQSFRWNPRDSKLSLNKASVEELQQALRGVGPEIAQKIVAARPYSNWSDVSCRVKGLGSKTVNGWKTDPRFAL